MYIYMMKKKQLDQLIDSLRQYSINVNEDFMAKRYR